MKQQIAIITLGVQDLSLSKKFYIKGFGWTPVKEDDNTAMYQMNGFILSTWLQSELEKDVTKSKLPRGGSITLAYLVKSPDEVKKYINILSNYGGKILRVADAPPHGGIRGYVADPDDHIWEIIYNPALKADERGTVIFGL
ncbi:MAG: VOC family protein [Candidatus Paracaedibacteraceae bacterium]|nr:VOC family protein [Candidatus Paracaedibacteraceae bacterium]